jgi:WhiB family transcriptional regulator, redox-sensing transcriptional regulator
MTAVIELPNIDLPGFEPWETLALCARPWVDGEVFYPAKGGHDPERAKMLCRRCPVRTDCLDFALRHMDSVEGAGYWGFWAGTSERERREMLRDRKRAA